MSKLTHLDAQGSAHMVDVGNKASTPREAVATGRITMSSEALTAVRDGLAKKGDVLAVARVAGIMAAKKTSDLIPLCHPLALSKVTVDFDLDEKTITVTTSVRTTGPTGVEMEALTAASVALLTVYDMVKAVDRGVVIDGVTLVSKSGGRSGDWSRAHA